LIEEKNQTEGQPTKAGVEEMLQTPLLRRVGLPILRVLFSLLFRILGPVLTRGKYRVPKTGGVLILANHTADIDPIVVQLACPRPIHFMAKSELFEMRILGNLLRAYRAFPVKRGEPDRAAIKRCTTILKAGEAACLFPEGELSETGELLPLKPGLALIVRMAKVPVICLGIRGTRKVMPYGSVMPRPSFRTIHCQWGEPHQFADDATTEEVLAWAEGQLRSLTEQEL